ncbi:hypothetical protein NDA07_11585 [Microcoleus vaginatus DQ-U2]|uniref:hypothetical protein n=1 Tax=Microcoleus vaginatus TaxID=119532 RepID=UPI001685E62C|nr:hypothetical protein [Microcoleus sp. FACHB-DQ6]
MLAPGCDRDKAQKYPTLKSSDSIERSHDRRLANARKTSLNVVKGSIVIFRMYANHRF